MNNDGLTLNQLAERNAVLVSEVEKLRDERDRLAAENAALKKFCKNAAFDADYEAELGMERGGFTDALNNIETPATDRIVAGIKADGVEELADRLQKNLDEGDFGANEVGVIAGAIDCGREMAQQLREGAK